MPYYKGETVSDAFLQGMFAAYRDAYNEVAGTDEAETSDEIVQQRLEAASAEQVGSAALGRQDAGGDPVAPATPQKGRLKRGGAR